MDAALKNRVLLLTKAIALRCFIANYNALLAPNPNFWENA